MDSQWRFVLCRLLVWAVAEIVFSSLGMDDLADYSEFLWEKDPSVLIAQQTMVR